MLLIVVGMHACHVLCPSISLLENSLDSLTRVSWPRYRGQPGAANELLSLQWISVSLYIRPFFMVSFAFQHGWNTRNKKPHFRVECFMIRLMFVELMTCVDAPRK